MEKARLASQKNGTTCNGTTETVMGDNTFVKNECVDLRDHMRDDVGDNLEIKFRTALFCNFDLAKYHRQNG